MVAEDKKRIIITSIIIIVMFIVPFLYLSHLLESRLPTLLGDRINATYFTYNLLDKSVIFIEPSFRMEGTDTLTNLEINATAESISIKGFSLWGLLISQKISVDQLEIDGLSVGITVAHFQTSDIEKREINLFFKEIFSEIGVGRFQLNHGSFLIKKKDSLTNFLVVNDFNILANQVLVDSGTVKHVFPLTFNESQISVGDFRLRLGEDYWLSGDKLEIADTRFGIENLKLEPILTPSDFATKYYYEKPQFHVNVKKLFSDQFFWSIDSENQVSFSSVKTSFIEPEVEVYKQKEPVKERLEKKSLLGKIIRDLPFKAAFDTVVVKRGFLSYEQSPERSSRSGEIFFSEVYMTAYNVVNDSLKLKSNSSKTIIDMKCRIMGKGSLDTRIQLDVGSENDAFNVSGRLSSMAFDTVNQILTPLSGIRASGALNLMDFSVEGNNYASTGSVSLDYSDLNIEFINPGKKTEWLKSGFGNLMIRNNNDPRGAKGLKKGTIYFVRYQNKGFFNFLWNSLRVGLTDVIQPFYQNPDEDLIEGSIKLKY